MPKFIRYLIIGLEILALSGIFTAALEMNAFNFQNLVNFMNELLDTVKDFYTDLINYIKNLIITKSVWIYPTI